MRILVLTPTFLPVVGGAELLVLHVFRRLAERHDVMVLTPRLDCDFVQQTGSSEYASLVNFPVIRFDDDCSFMKLRGHRKSLGLIPPFSISAARAMADCIDTFHPDVVNAHYCMPMGLAALHAEIRRNVPTVLSLTGRDVPGPDVPPMWKYWHRLVGSRLSGRTYVTDFCRKAVYGKQAGARHGRVILNGVNKPSAVDAQQAEYLRTELAIPENGKMIFALQRLDAIKRVDVLISAMPAVLKNHPDARLVIGGKGPSKDDLEAQARKLGVAHAVTFTGFIPDAQIPLYMDAADLFAFHSTYETFGIVLAEAMIRGRAVVSANDPAIAEVVQDGTCGLLAPIGDHAQFAKHISTLLEDDAKRTTMGKAGRQRAEQCFQWDTIALEYEAAFREAINAKGE